MKGQPNRRAMLMMGAITALMSQPGMNIGMVFNQLGAYRSRGKGGKCSRYCRTNHGNKPGKYMPHQGAKECARRRRQLGLGV